MARVPASIQPLEARCHLASDPMISSLALVATRSVEVDGVSYFFADDGKVGRELWRSDGTAGGTTLVKDLTPGAPGTEVWEMIELHGRAIFIVKGPGAMDDSPQVRNWQGVYEVWISDGTEPGTIRLARYEGVSAVQDLTAFGGGKAAWSVLDPSPTIGPTLDGWLYTTDGSVGGTVLTGAFEGRTVWSLTPAGDRLIFTLDFQEVWSTSGAPGDLLDLDRVMTLPNGGYVDPYTLLPVAGGVVMLSPGQGVVWFTDGTAAGTRATRWESREHFDTSAVAGGKFYFIGVSSAPNGQDIIKRLWVVDPVAGTQPLRLFQTGGDGSDNHFTLRSLGDKLIFQNAESGDNGESQTWVTDGTSEGTFMLSTAADRREMGLAAVEHEGVLYTVRLADRLGVNTLPDSTHFIGGLQPNNLIGGTGTTDADFRIELVRTDGSLEGTGVARTIGVDQIQGRETLFGLSVVNGQIALRTKVAEGIEPNRPWSSASLTPVSDTTVLYDPRELTIGRAATSVRLINGSLRIGGTNEADDILVFRRRNNPTKLVVQINGQQHDFRLSQVRRVSADLQAGDDRLEIRETTGGALRVRSQILAGDGADRIYTASGRDTVMGGLGSDRIVTRGGADVVIGGGGKDRINTGGGQDFVNGGEGRDVVSPGADVDLVFAQTRIESVFTAQLEPDSAREDMRLW